MRSILLSFVFLLGSAPLALALSCIPPDVVRAFQAAKDAPEAYRVVLGTLDLLERPSKSKPARAQRLKARLTGKSLGPNGFTATYDRPVTLTATCAGPWCGGPVSGEVLAFVKDTGSGQVLVSDPCSTWIFPAPKQADVNRITACAKGRRCRPAKF